MKETFSVWQVAISRSFGDIEQGPQKPHAIFLAFRCHAGEAVDAAAFGKTHQNGFRLIFNLMGQQQMSNVAAVAGIEQ